MVKLDKYEQDIGVEAINDNVEEIEYEFYAYIDNIEQLKLELKKASKVETQEQWNLIFNKKDLKSEVRVRKCVVNGAIRFELANKIRLDGLNHPWELETDVQQHHFEHIKDISKNGMIKTRYFFPIAETDMVWEVDVFNDLEGKIQPWVKLDLEVHGLLTKVPDYPITSSKWIEEQFSERSPEVIDEIAKLYRNYFIVRK